MKSLALRFRTLHLLQRMDDLQDMDGRLSLERVRGVSGEGGKARKKLFKILRDPFECMTLGSRSLSAFIVHDCSCFRKAGWLRRGMPPSRTKKR